MCDQKSEVKMAKRQSHHATSTRGRPRNQGRIVFVLWDTHFEELAATILLTTMRAAGLRTELVGLTSREAAGTYGMILQCDLTLSEALPLAVQAMCVILPCSSAILSRVENDPQLYLFLQRSLVNTPIWVVQDHHILSQSSFQGLLTPSLEVVSYDNGLDLAQTGECIADRLHQR